MSTAGENESAASKVSQEEVMSALFAHMVIQNTNMALMFLGHVPHPQTGEKTRDIEAARMFIDQLEMLEFKTKGNLTRDEEKLLQQSLMHLRLSFVEAVEHSEKTDSAVTPETSTAKSTGDQPAGETPPGSVADAESRKRYSKKY